LYGAFPTDPYSHTPGGKGAQQPGMTGQVKEDILTRFGELGITIHEGKLSFKPSLLRRTEFLEKTTKFEYITVTKELKNVILEKGSLGFTYCQVPIIYCIADSNGLDVHFSNGDIKRFENLELDSSVSKQIFDRRGEVNYIQVRINQSQLK